MRGRTPARRWRIDAVTSRTMSAIPLPNVRTAL